MLSYSCSSGNRESSTSQAPKAEKSAIAEKMHPGKIIYLQFCLACHMENGEGVPGLYPPLVQTDYILGEKGRLIKTVLHGMEGPIEVKGLQYNNVMAKLDYLQDQQIADVLTYIRSNFGNNAEAITAMDVRAVRDEHLN